MISIIVPVYNSESVLPACIDSILNQTLCDFELILINDGSTDNSGRVCDEYVCKDKRIISTNKINNGVSSARNIGLEFASGDYICFIDSDDNISFDYLKLLFDVLQNDSDLAICGFSWIKNNKEINKTLYSDNKLSVVNKKRIMDFMNLVSAPWAKLFRLDIIKNNHLSFPEDISYGEDLLFNLSYIDKIERIKIINLPLYHYYVDNQNSLLRKYNPELYSNFEIINSEIYFYLKSWEAEDDQFLQFTNKEYYDYENVLRNTFSKDNPVSYCEKLKYNRRILKSNEFQRVLKKSDVRINKVYRIAYKLHSYYVIRLYNVIVSKIKRE